MNNNYKGSYKMNQQSPNNQIDYQNNYSKSSQNQDNNSGYVVNSSIYSQLKEKDKGYSNSCGIYDFSPVPNPRNRIHSVGNIGYNNNSFYINNQYQNSSNNMNNNIYNNQYHNSSNNMNININNNNNNMNYNPNTQRNYNPNNNIQNNYLQNPIKSHYVQTNEEYFDNQNMQDNITKRRYSQKVPKFNNRMANNYNFYPITQSNNNPQFNQNQRNNKDYHHNNKQQFYTNNVQVNNNIQQFNNSQNLNRNNFQNRQNQTDINQNNINNSQNLTNDFQNKLKINENNNIKKQINKKEEIKPENPPNNEDDDNIFKINDKIKFLDDDDRFECVSESELFSTINLKDNQENSNNNNDDYKNDDKKKNNSNEGKKSKYEMTNLTEIKEEENIEEKNAFLPQLRDFIEKEENLINSKKKSKLLNKEGDENNKSNKNNIGKTLSNDNEIEAKNQEKNKNNINNVRKNQKEEDEKSLDWKSIDDPFFKCGTVFESVNISDKLPNEIHNHSLLVKNLSNEICTICLNKKSCKKGYKCNLCPLIICEQCSKMIILNHYSKTKHEHSLCLVNDKNSNCNICKKKLFSNKNFVLNCKKCNFNICLKCYYPERKEKMEEEQEEQEDIHEHPLEYISELKGFICNLCENQTNQGYKCISCKLILCKNCKDKMYNHKKRKELHGHPLFLTIRKKWKCNKCQSKFNEKVSFFCRKCSLDYCVDCFLY